MTSSMPSSAAMRSAVALAVAGKHDRPDAQLAQRADGLGGGLARGVGDGDDGRGLAVDRRPARSCGPRRRARPSGRPRPSRGDALALEQPGVADGEPVTVDGRQQAVAGHGLERLRARRLQAARRAALTIAWASGCSLSPSAAATRRSTSFSSTPSARRDLDDLRLAARERAGLVEDDRVERGGLLERDRVLEQDAALGARGRCRP